MAICQVLGRLFLIPFGFPFSNENVSLKKTSARRLLFQNEAVTSLGDSLSLDENNEGINRFR